jgi:uncharacterized protein
MTKKQVFMQFFLENGIEYKYEIDLIRSKVFKESIYRKDKLIIERIGNKLTENTIDEFKELKSMILRNNVSLISTAKQYGSKSIDVIYHLFINIIGNVHAYGLAADVLDYNTIAGFYYQDTVLFNFLKEILTKTDTWYFRHKNI